MWRFRVLIVTGVLAAVLVFGAVMAEGAWYWNAWYWNAAASGEGVDFRTAWKVVDPATDTEIDGDEYNYHAEIELRVPKNSGFTLVEKASVEDVLLWEKDGLECKEDGIEAAAFYQVRPLEGAVGNKVMVWVTANGKVVQQATGELNETIKIQFLIPAPDGVTPACHVRD